MVRHIVIWKKKEDTTREQLEMLLRESETLKSIEGVISLEFSIDPLNEVNQDIVLNALYTDKNALDNYVTHPIHVEFGKKLRPLVAEKNSFDYNC